MIVWRPDLLDKRLLEAAFRRQGRAPLRTSQGPQRALARCFPLIVVRSSGCEHFVRNQRKCDAAHRHVLIYLALAVSIVLRFLRTGVRRWQLTIKARTGIRAHQSKGPQMFRLALHSVSYAGMWPGQAKLSLFEFLNKANELGFEAVMLMAKRPHLSVLDTTPAQRNVIKQRLRDRNLKVACLAGYTDFTIGADHPEIPTREMQVLYVRELARLAAELECPMIRVFTGYSTSLVSHDQQWLWCVECLRECAQQAAEFGVTIGVQNHHDTAVHQASLADLIRDVDHANCKLMFDAWAPALQGCDPVEGVRALAPNIIHTTVADYVRRPRFKYQPNLVNYATEPDSIRAVPMGEGFIDYPSFFRALKETGYQGYVAYEMCSMMRGGGSLENLDRTARQFKEYMSKLT